MRRRTVPGAIVSARSGGPRRRWTRFVAVALATYGGTLAAVLLFNTIIDPFGYSGAGLVPPAVEHDRAAKLRLLEDLDDSPDILILGSSRARMAEPAVLERLTGHDGFNAAVTSGTPSDAWVMVRYAADRFPDEPRRYVWFVDLQNTVTEAVHPQFAGDRLAQKYLGGDRPARWPDPDHVAQYLALQTTRISLRVLRACIFESCRSPIEFLDDGAVVPASDSALPEHAPRLGRSVARHVAKLRRRGVLERAPAQRGIWFERVLEFMNGQGARPVLVLNAIHPAVMRERERLGYGKRKEATLRSLRSLAVRLEFVVVDGQDISDWGGSPREWLDSNHLTRTNMRRLLAYVVEHSDGALD